MAADFSKRSRIGFMVALVSYAIILGGGYFFYYDTVHTSGAIADICSGTNYDDQIMGAAILGYIFGLRNAIRGMIEDLRNKRSPAPSIALSITSILLILTAYPLGHYIQNRTIAKYASKFSVCR